MITLIHKQLTTLTRLIKWQTSAEIQCIQWFNGETSDRFVLEDDTFQIENKTKIIQFHCMAMVVGVPLYLHFTFLPKKKKGTFGKYCVIILIIFVLLVLVK